MVHRNKVVCDPENLQNELNYLWTIFLQNYYGSEEIVRVMREMWRRMRSTERGGKGLAVSNIKKNRVTSEEKKN